MSAGRQIPKDQASPNTKQELFVKDENRRLDVTAAAKKEVQGEEKD